MISWCGAGEISIRAFWNHTGARNLGRNFFAGQVPADAGLGALADFDFDGSRSIQVIQMDAETPRGHLGDGVFAELVEFGVQAGPLRIQ